MGWCNFQKLVTGHQSQSNARILPLIYRTVLSHPSQPLPSVSPPPVEVNGPLSPFLTPFSDSRFQIPFSAQPHQTQTKDFRSFNLSPASFSFGPFFLIPDAFNGLVKTDVDGCFLEDSATPRIWADSVKKKRKRKMNKHKLRKLRRRLRRKA